MPNRVRRRSITGNSVVTSGSVAGPEERGDRPIVAVEHDAQNHLVQRPKVLGDAALTKGGTTPAPRNTARWCRRTRPTGHQTAAGGGGRVLPRRVRSSGGRRRSARRAMPWPCRPLQGECLGARDAQTLVPVMGVGGSEPKTIRGTPPACLPPADRFAMVQHDEIDGTLDIEANWRSPSRWRSTSAQPVCCDSRPNTKSGPMLRRRSSGSSPR
jgi:hypothetical protein